MTDEAHKTTAHPRESSDTEAAPPSATAVFVEQARKFGPFVGALAFLSLTLPGFLGSFLLIGTIFEAGSPANFHNPDAPQHHRLLGTWATSIPLPPRTTDGDEPATLALALRPADPDSNTASATAPRPLNADAPDNLKDGQSWTPYRETDLIPGQRTLELPSQDDTFPSINLSLQPAADPTNDTLAGTYSFADDATERFTATRRVPIVQQWIIDLGAVAAAVAVAALFAFCTGSALLPTYALSFAAGVFFGPVTGSVVAMVGVTGGALIGYGWGALLARRRVSRVIDDNPRAAIVRAAIVNKPLPQELFAVILLRFPPNSPFALTNLIMSSVGVRLLPYAVGTAIGIAPRTLFAVIIGVAVNNLADAQSAGGITRILIGLAIGIAVFVYAYKVLSKWARDALNEADAAHTTHAQPQQA
jgi:uncharacterized membrane protein YdjX (TVP38/TMEM64 family)